MNGVQASSPVSKRTSINELLNPIGRDAAATPVSKHETLPSMSSVVSLPSFPSMITVPVHYFPNGGPPPMYIPVQHHHQTMQHPGQRLQHLNQAPAPEPHHAQQTSTSSFSLRRAEWSGSTAPRRAANNGNNIFLVHFSSFLLRFTLTVDHCKKKLTKMYSFLLLV